MESLRLEYTTEIIRSNGQLTTAMPTKSRGVSSAVQGGVPISTAEVLNAAPRGSSSPSLPYRLQQVSGQFLHAGLSWYLNSSINCAYDKKIDG